MQCKASVNYDWSRETYLLLKLISNRHVILLKLIMIGVGKPIY
jgi:hypothetical protein